MGMGMGICLRLRMRMGLRLRQIAYLGIMRTRPALILTLSSRIALALGLGLGLGGCTVGSGNVSGDPAPASATNETPSSAPNDQLVHGPDPADCPRLPEGFVFLNTVDPSIEVDLRYASTENFTGEVVDGYQHANAVVLREDAALSLAEVQTTLSGAGLGLLVYDGFRPTRSVEFFMEWAQSGDDDTQAAYYPEYEKPELFELGYIAQQSGHSLGGTVDLTLIDRDSGEPLDMGSPFDLFDERSHYAAPGLSEPAFENRTVLREAMMQAGFEPYPQEWWHFSYPVPTGAERLDFALEPCG